MKTMNKLEKWYSILELAGIKENKYEKVAAHMEKLTAMEFGKTMVLTEIQNGLPLVEMFSEEKFNIKNYPLLPLELKVISRIKDLSKVKFIQNLKVDINTNQNLLPNIIEINNINFKISLSVE
jgi:hypothetical protein